jgi:putative nucleotidyltransferase with HDIG domain
MRDFSKRLPVEPPSSKVGIHTGPNFLQSILAALNAHDAYTYRHSVRTVRLSLTLARAYGLDGEQLRTLCLGALLHDVGKVCIPEAVLHKPEPLSALEWAVVQRHPQQGAALLRNVPSIAGAVLVVAEHHERWDGTGYPKGLAGTKIDLNARIVAVADAYDAMTSARAYRPARLYEAAMTELARCAGTQFDPLVVTAFGAIPRACIEAAARQA